MPRREGEMPVGIVIPKALHEEWKASLRGHKEKEVGGAIITEWVKMSVTRRDQVWNRWQRVRQSYIEEAIVEGTKSIVRKDRRAS